jgi:hypothetical protein
MGIVRLQFPHAQMARIIPAYPARLLQRYATVKITIATEQSTMAIQAAARRAIPALREFARLALRPAQVALSYATRMCRQAQKFVETTSMTTATARSTTVRQKSVTV